MTALDETNVHVEEHEEHVQNFTFSCLLPVLPFPGFTVNSTALCIQDINWQVRRLKEAMRFANDGMITKQLLSTIQCFLALGFSDPKSYRIS